MSKRVGEAIQTELEKAGHEVTLVDPATLDIPILKTPLHWYPGNISTAFVGIEDSCAYIAWSAQ